MAGCRNNFQSSVLAVPNYLMSNSGIIYTRISASFRAAECRTKEKWGVFSKNVYYQVSDVKNAETYKEFGKRIDKHTTEWKTKPNVIYYLAVSPNLFPIIASNIAKAKLAEDKNKIRIVIEKPFRARPGNGQGA